MTYILRKHSLLTSICFIVALTGGGQAALTGQAQNVGEPSSASNVPPSLAPFSTAQLDAMVAPIALYPDALVAQVLAAALYPDQIAFADDWLGQNSNLTPIPLAQAVDQQPWDPSVKALSQFPTVLHNLARNLAWTSNLGQAFENQQSDTMAAVQAMRARAQAAGTLQSTNQVRVVQASPQTIVIQPANPQVVYVPQYNPAVVFGSPFVVPLYTPPPIATAAVSFGAGVAIGAALGGGWGGGGVSWGFSSWNCNWGGGGGGNVIYNHNTYINKTVVNNNGNNYNNYHPWGPRPQGPTGPHPYNPNGNNGLIGGNGGTQHLIGGNGGTQHLIGGNGGTQHLIGGNGGVEHFPNNPMPDRYAGMGAAGRAPHSPFAGNGNQARAELNRGFGSMQQRPGAQGGMRNAPVRRR